MEQLLSPRPVIAFFGYDSNEWTLVKRISAFKAEGADLFALTFTRDREGASPNTTFENIHLGFTVDRNYLRRLPSIVRGLIICCLHARRLREADIFYARNIDMIVIAAVVKYLTFAPAALAYEVLDVQRIFLGDRPINRIMRFVERSVLRHCRLLVVSSPAFVTRYFLPALGYTGPWFLLENKISAAQIPPDVDTKLPVVGTPPWVIGWFGRLRCRKSLDILCKIAERLGERVFIQIRGLPSEEDLTVEQIRAALSPRKNMNYGGAYLSPADLPAIYSEIHFSWSIDFLDVGTNSDWLLPNRIYEGGLFGALAMTRDNTATATKVAADGLGYVFREPLEDSVSEFLDQLSEASFLDRRDRLQALPRSVFVDEHDTESLLHKLMDGSLSVRSGRI